MTNFYKTTIFVTLLVLISLLGYHIKSVARWKDATTMVMADREYWRVMASYPEIACRFRSGEYHETAILVYFTTGEEKVSYKCSNMVIQRAYKQTEGLEMKLK